MQIFSGYLKGRKLQVPQGLSVRPTPGKVRAAIFDILATKIIDATFLDLYAGSGAMGIEAMSRGAAHVSFVESSQMHLKTLNLNLALLQNTESYELFCGEALSFLDRTKRSFDFLFLDPPYESSELEKLLPRLGASDIMASSGRLIVEHKYKHSLPETVGCLCFSKQYRYGETTLSFYEKQ